MRNAKAALLAVTVAITACTSDDATAPLGTPVPRPTTTLAAATPAPPTTRVPGPEPATPPSTPTPDPADGAPVGSLVILDASGDVAVLAPTARAEPVKLTDAFAAGAAYFQPLWSPDSQRLAFAEASPAGFGLVTIRSDGSERAVAGMPSPPFYFYWSPDGSRIAAMHNGLNGVELKLVDAGGTVGTFAGSGLPFYISWSPDASLLAAHIGSDRLTTIGADGGTKELGITAEGYQSPQWTEAGIVHLAEEGLELLDSAGSTSRLADVTGAASFVLNPQGTRLAVQSFSADAPGVSVAYQSTPEIRPNIVAVVDLATGDVETAAGERSIGFFWSPDGEKLLMLHPSGRPGIVEASIWDEAGTRPVVRFAPPTSFLSDVLAFFPQYAQSYQMWGPDSAHFAFAGRVDDTEGVWVQGLDGTDPVKVAEGTWVAWSDS